MSKHNILQVKLKHALRKLSIKVEAFEQGSSPFTLPGGTQKLQLKQIESHKIIKIDSLQQRYQDFCVMGTNDFNKLS